MKKEDNQSTTLPKERYNILNGSIPLTEEEKVALRQNMNRAAEFLKKSTI